MFPFDFFPKNKRLLVVKLCQRSANLNSKALLVPDFLLRNTRWV